jgi:hypothetical protein
VADGPQLSDNNSVGCAHRAAKIVGGHRKNVARVAGALFSPASRPDQSGSLTIQLVFTAVYVKFPGANGRRALQLLPSRALLSATVRKKK